MKTLEVALVVVHRRGRTDSREFLVVLRSSARGGYWHLVGGGVEEGETPAEAARRELEEETELSPPVSLEEVSIPLGYPDGDEWVTIHVFVSEAPAEWEPVLEEEHVDYRWCSVEEAMEMLAYEEPRAALREAAQALGVPA